jgi:hypothetical protein
LVTRLGIELSPDACRIVEIDPAPLGERRRGGTRVRSFAVLPPSGPETDAKLRSLRKRRAAVVVWNTASDHRQVLVSPGSYASMRAEAIGALDAAGVETRGVWVDIAPEKRSADRAASRAVVVALASGSELTAALRPLLAAGIRVRTVMTPAAALSSLARLRRESWTPDALEVFVALEERATCIALMRAGALIASRDMEWGFVDEFGSGFELRGRDDIVTRLVKAISDFSAATGGSPGDIKHVCVCGGHPELRSVTAPLMEQLDVEFEPLDSLFGIDTARLPEPVDEFRERGAELRVAWAAAADSPPTINLLRARNRQASKTMLVRAAVVAGVAAGLVVGWRVQSRWSSPVPTAPARQAANVSPGAGRATAAPPTAASTAPPVVTASPVAASSTSPVGTPPQATATRTLPVLPPARVPASRTPPVATPPASTNRPPPLLSPPVAASRAPPVVLPPQPATAQARAAIVPPPVVPREEPRQPSAVQPAVAPVARDAPASLGQVPTRARESPAPPPEVAWPFDAVIGTILYSPDRRLAIIDGQIVGPGDEVRGARIVDITPGTVTLKDGQGRLRRLTMDSGAR